MKLKARFKKSEYKDGVLVKSGLVSIFAIRHDQEKGPKIWAGGSIHFRRGRIDFYLDTPNRYFTKRVGK